MRRDGWADARLRAARAALEAAAEQSVVATQTSAEPRRECREEEFFATGVNGEKFNVIEKALDERTIGHNPERMCLMKGGVVYSNKVTTVSPTYAKETLDGNGGFMSKILKANQEKFSGILNGIDYDLWNPALDATLPANFAPGNKMTENKKLCKKYLQKFPWLFADDL